MAEGGKRWWAVLSTHRPPPSIRPPEFDIRNLSPALPLSSTLHAPPTDLHPPPFIHHPHHTLASSLRPPPFSTRHSRLSSPPGRSETAHQTPRIAHGPQSHDCLLPRHLAVCMASLGNDCKLQKFHMTARQPSCGCSISNVCYSTELVDGQLVVSRDRCIDWCTDPLCCF